MPAVGFDDKSDKDADSGEIVTNSGPAPRGSIPRAARDENTGTLPRDSAARNIEQAILQLFHQTRANRRSWWPSITLAWHQGDEHPGHAQAQGATLLPGP